MSPISILIVDDHALLRETLRDRLDREPDLAVVASVSSAEEAVTRARDLAPDVILMDIDMPGRCCFDAARSIKSQQPETSIVFLSAFLNDRYIDSALAAQASGYLTKDQGPDDIVAAIRTTAAGVACFSPRVQSRIVLDAEGASLPDSGRSRATSLTNRELEVLRYIARGLPKKEIATMMSVSVKTVNRHTENLMGKLEIHDRVDLARFAIREGLAEP